MYGFNEDGYITKEQILAYFDQSKIVEEMITGYPVICYERILSPFRTDESPKCFFEWYNEKLWFIDFADRPTHRDIFNMIQDRYGVNYKEAIEMIGRHFCNTNLENPITGEKKGSHPITFKSRQFDTRDRNYWQPIGITREQLMEDGVFAATWYKFYSRKAQRNVIIRPSDPCYAYTKFVTTTGERTSDKVKIYRPLSKNVKSKWLTNCTADDIGGLHIPFMDYQTLVISKSYKDWRVLRNAGVRNCIWFQNEGMFPSEDFIINCLGKFENIFVLFDNDEPGLIAAENLAEYINSLFEQGKAHPIFIPLHLGCKDPAELRKTGQNQLQEVLKQLQCISL